MIGFERLSGEKANRVECKKDLDIVPRGYLPAAAASYSRRDEAQWLWYSMN